MKVLHVLYQSLPNSAGSSIRSRDIINNQFKIGLKPVVITSPFQPPFEKDKLKEIDSGIIYYRTFSKEKEVVKEKLTDFFTQIKKFLRIIYFSFQVYKIAKKENVDIIHAHAMFYCAFPAKIASFLLKKPMIYEVRSLWEERYKSGNILVKILFEAITFIETIAMLLSDRIIVINKNLKCNLQNRFFLRKCKFNIISNAVDISKLKIIKSSKRKIIFSYIGTISPIEGLDLLVKAFNNLYKKGFNHKLFFFGDGLELNNLMQMSDNNPHIEFRGRFLQKDISKVYSEVDIVVNPRIKNFLTDSVTPLKPLEAMAYKKLVLASDVGGMKELIINGQNGILFKSDSIQEIEKVILDVVNRNDIDDIVENAYSYIKHEKNWLKNAELYKEIYYNLIHDKKN